MADKDNKSKLTYHVWDKDNNEYDIPDEVVQQRGMDNFAKDFEGGYITMFDDKKQKVDVPIEDVGEYRKQGYMWYDTSGNATPINEVGNRPSPSKEKEQSQYPQEVIDAFNSPDNKPGNFKDLAQLNDEYQRGELKKPGLISQAFGMIPKVDAGNIGREQKMGGMIANMLLGDNMQQPLQTQQPQDNNQQVQQPAQQEASPESKEEVSVPASAAVVNNEGLMDAKLANYLENWKQRPDKQGTYFENMVADLLADGTANSNEEAVKMVQSALGRYANRSAMDVTNQVVASLPDDTVQDAEKSIEARWYSHGVQDKLKQEADSMGISYDDYVGQFLKPAMVQSLVNKYGPNYRDIAEGIATRLYSHDEHVQDRLMNQDINEALSDVINKYVNPSIVEEYNKAQEAGSKAFTEGMEGSQFIPANLRLGTALGAQYEANEAKDPAKVLSSLQKKFGNLYRNPQFLNDMSNAAFKVMQRYGLNGGMSGDPKQFKPMINSVLKNELDQLEIKGMMPKGSAEYIMKTGLGNTIVGKITRKAVQTDYQNWLEDIANQQYQPGFWENVASGALTFAGDAWSYWLPGAAGGKLTKSMIAKAEGKLAGDLMAKGMESRMAARAAKLLIGKSKDVALKNGAVHGAVTFGGQSVISKPIDETYRTGQFDENGKIYNPSGWKIALDTLLEGTKQSALGVIMQGNTIANMLGKGRGLATNILADVGGKVVDSGIMTGHQMLERMAQDPNFKPTGKDAAESFLESMANLTAIGLPGMVGKYARFKDAREFNKKFDFTDQDIAELKRFGYDGLRDAFEKVGIGEYAVEGENAQRLDGQLTQKYMNLMNDKSVPEVLKAKMMAVVEGKRPSSFSPVVDSVIVQPMDNDGKVYLETLNKDGGIIDRQEYSSLDEAQKADKKLEYEKTLGLASVLEGEFHNEFTQEHLDGLYNKAAQKYNMGEKLTDEDKAAVYLHQNAGAIKDIMDKQQKGIIITEEEQKQVDAYRHYYDSALENSSVMREFVNTFEDSHGVARGTLRKALESKDKKYAPLVESYLKELYNSIELKREMKQTMDDLYNTAHGNEQKRIEQSGVEGEKPAAPVEGAAPVDGSAGGKESAAEVPPTEPPTPPVEGEAASNESKPDAYVMGQNAYQNGDAEGLKAIDHNDDVSKARLKRAFGGDEAQMNVVVKAYEDGKDMEQFVAQRANSLTPAQQDAVNKYVEAQDAKNGVYDALQHADDGYGEALKEQLWPYQTEDGNIVPATLTTGQQVFLKKANEYGGGFVVVPDEQGQPTIKQVSSADIKEVGTPVPMDDYINQKFAEQVNARYKQFFAQYDGSGLKPSDTVEVAMESGDEPIQMTFAGYSEDGKILLSDGKDNIALSKDEFNAWRQNALDASIGAELDAEDAQRANDDAVKAEAEKQERYKKGIFGYAAGQPDYSDTQTDPKVAAEYLQETAGEDRKALFANIVAEKQALQKRINQLREHIANNEEWLSINADLDPKNAETRTLANKQMEGQIADLQARFDNWNKIRSAVMTPEEAQAIKADRTQKIADAGVNEGDVAPIESREVEVLSDEELKKQYPTMDEASDFIASERKRIYRIQSNEVQREIDGVDKVLDRYVNGEIDLEPDQIKELNTTKAQLLARQANLTESAKELKAQDDKLKTLYRKENMEARAKVLENLTPAEQRAIKVENAIKNGNMSQLNAIYDEVRGAIDFNDNEPNTLEEYVANSIGRFTLNYEGKEKGGAFSNGIQQETGLGRKDFDKLQILAKEGEGKTVPEFVHSLYDDMPKNLKQMGYTDQDIRSAFLNLIGSAQSYADIKNYTLNNKVANVEQQMREVEHQEEEMMQDATHSEAFDKIVELAKEQKEYWDLMEQGEVDPDDVPEVDVAHEMDELLKTLSDEEFKEVSDVLENLDEEFEYWTADEYERREGVGERKKKAENANIYDESIKEALKPVTPFAYALKSAVESGDKKAIKQAQKELTDALIASDLGLDYLSGQLAQAKLTKKKDELYKVKRATIKPLTDAIHAIESAKNIANAPFADRLKNAIAETETEPTEAQKKAGNYKKGHLSFGGYDFTVETPKGVTRSGKDEQGKPWRVTMHDTYGYILGKIGVDGDHIDMFINDAADLDTFDGNVYVVDQVNPETGEFDEHKVMYGYPSEEAATEAYLANYSKGWKGLGKVTAVPKATFDKWLQSSDRKTKPFADYAMIQHAEAQKAKETDEALPFDAPMSLNDLPFHRDVKEVKPSDMTETQKVAYDAVSTMLKKAGIPVKVVSNEDMEKVAEAQDNLNLAMLLNQPEMRFKIKTPEEKQAAENAYNFAKELRPDKWKQYAVVDMSNPNKMPEYFEKQELARKERSYYNKLMWGNYKVFNLDKSFEDNVAGLTGSFPSEFDPYKIDAQTNKRNELKKQIKETEEAYKLTGQERKEYQNQLMKEYMDEHVLASENDIPDDVWREFDYKAVEKYQDKLDSLFAKYKDLDRQLKAVAEPGVRFLRTYHGSGANFSEFDFDHMSEGAGSQVFGWGGYVTSSKKIGKDYASIKYDPDKDVEYVGKNKKTFTDLIATLFDGGIRDYNYVKNTLLEISDNDKSNISKKEEYDWFVSTKPEDWFNPNPTTNRNLYEVNIPEDNGSNYLEWEKKPSVEVATKIIEGLYGLDSKTLDDMASKDIVFRTLLYDYIKNADKEQMIPLLVKTHALTRGTTYDNGNVEDDIRFVYNRLSRWMGSPKAASRFLSSLGFTGIKYPAGTIMGGAEKGDTNYVIFNPKDMKIVDHTKFAQGKGVVYGYTDGKAIVLNQEHLNANTPIHEYQHLWRTAAKEMNPELIAHGDELIKQTQLFRDLKEDPNYKHLSDDEICDEAFARLTGEDGAAILEQMAKEAIKENPLDTAKELTIINRLKNWLKKFWYWTLDTFTKWKPEDIKKMTLEDIRNLVLRDLANSVDPRTVLNEKKAKKDDKTLAGVHNITEEKLRKALKLGGLANPSLAVIDTSKSAHDNFGEISFIAPSALVDKRTGKTGGTWITDAYTQRYPSVEREMSEKGRQKFNDWVDSLEYPSEAKAEIKRQAEDALSNNNAPAWELMYLKEKGIDIKEYDSRIDYRWKEIIKDHPTAEDILNSMNTDPELNEKVTGLAKHIIVDPIRGKISLEVRRKIYEETGVKMSSLNPQVRKQTKEIFERDYKPTLLDEDGNPKKEDIKKVVEDIVKEHNDTKKYDFYLSKVKASNYVNKNGLYDDYIRWQENKLDEFGTKNRIFRGYKNDGSRKYVPETLENVSKAMREDANGQTNGSEYTSFGSFIAKLASRVDSTDEMRANKDKLSSNEDKEEFYEKWSEVYYDLAKSLYNDVFYGEQRLHDIVSQPDPKKYAKKEYGITLTPSFMKKLDSLKNAVQNELKSVYFETKFNRPVHLNEFVAAVVPNNLGEDVRKGLEESGLSLYDYDPEKEGDRKRAFNEAINSNNEIRFHRVTEPEELDRLNKEKTFRMYSGMQEVDGKLYSPMAAIIDGKRTDATEIGAWMGADERPDLVKGGKFQLVKTDKNPGAGEGPVRAAYNPYMHTSTSMMNDQFTGAYARGNIKVVEWEIPESEKTSGYRAEGAKDAVGLVPWHSGSVNGLLPKDRQRSVMLSRWRKAVRVVPDSEVAESIAEQLEGTGLAIPWNVVTPNQVRELAKLGVPITTVESGMQAPETKEKFMAQMEELKKEFPQAQFVNVKMTKDAFKEWGGKNNVKLSLGDTVPFVREQRSINNAFNDALDKQIAGTLPKGYNYQLGKPSSALKFAGIEDLPIELSSRTLEVKSSKDYKSNHPFDLNSVKNLPVAIQRPVAIFDSEYEDGRKVILTELKDGKGHSIIAVLGLRKLRGRNYAEVNSIISLYGKDSSVRIANWFDSKNPNGLGLDKNLCRWADTKKASEWLTNNASNVHSVGLSLKRIAKVINSFENNQFSEENLLLKHNFGDILGNSEGIAIENMRKVADSVVNTANKLGGAEATVYSSLDDVPEEYRSEVEQGAKGWYDPETHTVHVYLPNCSDANEAERTVLHEKIGHEGMEVLLGGEDGVRKFANFVYRSASKDVRGKIIDFANKYDPDWKNPDRMNVGTQEYIAHLAEEGPKTAEDFSLWTKIKHYLIKVLKKLGVRVPGLLNDKDLRYYLMKAGKALHVWDEMPQEKQEVLMKQASNAEIKDALSDGAGKGKPRQKKGESAIQYMKRVMEWKRWKEAREDENDPEPPMFYDFDKDAEGKKEWERLNKEWRDSHHLQGDEMPIKPERKEGETDEAFFSRYKEWEKWNDAMADKENPMPDMFSFEKAKQDEARQKYEDWLTRHELNEQNDADLDLYEGKIYPAETNPEADALEQRVMQDLAEVTSTDVSKEGAAMTVKHAVIHRRKNMEEASADDAIYINDVKNRIEKMAGSGVYDKLLSDYKGKKNRAEKLAETIPYIIEAPRRLRDMAHNLNATGVFDKGHIHIQPADVEAIQPYVTDLITETAKKHTVIRKGKEIEVYDDPKAVSEVASKMAQAINANHQGEEGFVPIDGTDILSKHVLKLVKERVVPGRINYKELSPEMQSAIDSIRDWYNYTYDWLMDNHTLKAGTGYNVDYVNHIWDKEKSDPEAYATFVENRQRTKSPNEKPRTISTLMEGIYAGLVPKTTDITKMMAYYSRSNIEAWANKTMLQELTGLNVIERNEKGDVISSDPLLSSSAPFNLEQYKYFEIPGVGPVWVYNVSPKQVKVKNPITDNEKVIYSEASAGDRFGVVFETYQSSPFWKTFDTLASSAKKLELGFSGFHAGALTEVYMVQNMVEFGPKKAMANFMKYIFVDTMKNHELPCFANPEDFQEAATHLVKFGATNDYAAADVQNMFDNMRDAMMKVQEKLKDGNGISGTVAKASMPLKVATQMLSLINKGMDVALWDFLHDGLKLATYRMRADKTKERAKKKGWTEEELSRALDEDGQFVNDMFGGQHWDVLGASHRTLRYAGRVLLSPDWNASTTRHFLALTGFGSIWNEATFENFKQYYKKLKHKELTPEDEGRRSRQISALLCYGIGFMVFYEGIANGINAAFRALDEEKERKKAEEIRKTNPSYRSPYELAYPDGMKWYDYLMRGNSLGQQSKIFLGRYADGTEMYIRHGKQFREVPEYLFNHKGELEFPGPMVQRMIGKANPMVRMTLDDINYLSDFQASHADQEIQRKYGKTIGLLYKDALYWAPFLIPSQENKEFKAVDFFFPSSKGFSPWKAQSYFKDFILSGDMEGVVMTYQSCQRNGIDPEAQIKAAIGSVKALESAEMSDGVTSLQEASKRFDAAKSITEKKKMRQKMKKFLSQSEYKAFTQKEALDMVQGYLNGDEDLKEMEKAESKYLMKAKAEDVTEDWRIQNVWNGTMETYQEYQRLKDVDKAKANAFKNSKTNKRLFAARKAISAAKKKMNKAKKQMDGQNDAAKLVEIRKTRKELLETLNGME
jgi:hypothetical protein